MTLRRRCRVFERVATLPLAVDEHEFVELQHGVRQTTVIRLRGSGVDGYGEDVTHDEADRRAFRRLNLRALRGTTTVGAFAAALDAFDLARGATWPVVRAYRRWALESAALDLALRQARLNLAAALRLPAKPVRVVVSLRVDDAAPVFDVLARHPTLRFKVDARACWSEATVAALAASRAIEVIDLKGTAAGSPVYERPDVGRYAALARTFPDALFEDPAPELAGLLPRVAWDEPLQDIRDLDRLPPAVAVNVKPARLGSLAGTLELIRYARERAIALYGGGHSELGVGRGQARLLAALFYPDGPNDLAPRQPTEARLLPTALTGFRWD